MCCRISGQNGFGDQIENEGCDRVSKTDKSIAHQSVKYVHVRSEEHTSELQSR